MAGDRVEHQFQRGGVAEKDALLRQLQKVGKDFAQGGQSFKAAVVPAIDSFADRLFPAVQNGQQSFTQRQLRFSRLSSGHIQGQMHLFIFLIPASNACFSFSNSAFPAFA